MKRSSRKRDALDQLRFEDIVLSRLLIALSDKGQNRRRHGRTIKTFIERMAVRQAARELVLEAVAPVPELAAMSADLRAGVPDARAQMDQLDELTRGIASTNLNQAQDVDAAIDAIEPHLRAEIEVDLNHLIPMVERTLGPDERTRLLPSASYVLRHCPLHPGAHPRRWYERIGPLVWIHSVYDYLRNLPVGGIKPTATVQVPGSEELTPESVEGPDPKRDPSVSSAAPRRR